MEPDMENTDMKPTQPDACPCADAAPEHRSAGRIAVGFVIVVALAAIVVLGETWAIERAPMLPKAVIHVFSDGHGNSPVPTAIVH
jgi:hypothetical protein